MTFLQFIAMCKDKECYHCIFNTERGCDLILKADELLENATHSVYHFTVADLLVILDKEIQLDSEVQGGNYERTGKRAI